MSSAASTPARTSSAAARAATPWPASIRAACCCSAASRAASARPTSRSSASGTALPPAGSTPPTPASSSAPASPTPTNSDTRRCARIAAIRKLGESTHGFRDLAKPVKGVDKADTDRILDLLQRRAALLDSQIAPRVRAAIRARKAARDLPAFEIEYRKEVGEERFKRSLAAAQRRVRNVNANRHGMTDPELVAVWHYTGSGYRPLNSSLRSADPQPRQRVDNFKRTLAAATAPLPRTQGRLRPLPQRRRRRDGRPARRPRLRRRHQGAPRRHRGRPRIRARPAHTRDVPRRVAAARPLHGACLAVFRPIPPAESAAFPTVPATATDPESGYFWPPTRATTRAESASRPRQSSRRRSPTRSSTRWAHACATCPSRRTPC